MGTRKYLAQTIFGMSILLIAQSYGNPVENEERDSVCCRFLRFFVRSQPAPTLAFTVSPREEIRAAELLQEDSSEPQSPNGYANVPGYENMKGYSNTPANDLLEDLSVMRGLPLESAPPSDGRHLSFRDGVGEANYVPTDSSV